MEQFPLPPRQRSLSNTTLHYIALCYIGHHYSTLLYTIHYITAPSHARLSLIMHLPPQVEQRVHRNLRNPHPRILYYTILYYTILYYTILYYTILYYTMSPSCGWVSPIMYLPPPSRQPSLPASLAKWLRRPPRERKIPGLNLACAGIFPGSSHTSDLQISTPVATLPGAWRYRVSAGTGWPGVSIL